MGEKRGAGFGVQGGHPHSPTQLPPPSLVGVKEALAKMQGIEHPVLQLHPAPLILLDSLQLPEKQSRIKPALRKPSSGRVPPEFGQGFSLCPSPASLCHLDCTDPQQLQHLRDETRSFVCLDVFQVPAKGRGVGAGI